MQPAIRFIVDTYAQMPDRFGNVARWARITSTITGRTLTVANVGGSQNVPSDVRMALEPQRPRNFDVWSWVHYSEHDVPRKRWSTPEAAIFESDLTADMILELERPI